MLVATSLTMASSLASFCHMMESIDLPVPLILMIQVHVMHTSSVHHTHQLNHPSKHAIFHQQSNLSHTRFRKQYYTQTILYAFLSHTRSLVYLFGILWCLCPMDSFTICCWLSFLFCLLLPRFIHFFQCNPLPFSAPSLRAI
eukprot:106721_1